MYRGYNDTIIAAFRKTGVSLRPDDSDDTEISIKGVDNIIIGDCQRKDNVFQAKDTQVIRNQSKRRVQIKGEKELDDRLHHL